MTYKTKGICAKEIQVEILNGKVQEVQFVGGCMGITVGISALVKGLDVQQVIEKLQGIDCGGRGTSCPDQLAKALKQYNLGKEEKNE